MSRVAFLGLGAMGSRMAVHLRAAGHSLRVYNRTASRTAPLVEHGAEAAASPRAAAAGADLVISMVTDDAAARAIWLDEMSGALAALAPAATAIECSTMSVAGAADLERAFARAGRAFLAAPVLGSLPQAEAKALIVLAGGEAAARERALPVLQAMAGRIVPLAAPAQAVALKLAINAMFSAQVAVLADLLPMLTQAGLEPAAVQGVIADLPTTSPALAGAAALLVKGDDAPRYPIRLVAKDLGYVTAAAPGTSAVIGAVADRFRHALAQGLGERNISAIGRVFS